VQHAYFNCKKSTRQSDCCFTGQPSGGSQANVTLLRKDLIHYNYASKQA
jgi:hypothetical protein